MTTFESFSCLPREWIQKKTKELTDRAKNLLMFRNKRKNTGNYLWTVEKYNMKNVTNTKKRGGKLPKGKRDKW